MDVRNRLAGDTPLHIAVRTRYDDAPGLRLYLGTSLIPSVPLPAPPHIVLPREPNSARYRQGSLLTATELRLTLVQSLLDAGSNTTIKNRHAQRPIDILPPAPDDEEEPEDEDGQVRVALRRAEGEAMVADRGDVVGASDPLLHLSSFIGVSYLSYIGKDHLNCASSRAEMGAEGVDDDDIIDPNDIASDSD